MIIQLKSAANTGNVPSPLANGELALNFQDQLLYYKHANGNVIVLANGQAITSGTLAVARGGTGQTSYTNGQILIGNTGSTGLDKATIAQSAPVIVTNLQGSITLSHARSGVVAVDSYGSPAIVPVIAVDANGHITAAVNTTIAISAAAVTSGILAVARGGTGKDATGLANGQILIGNTVNTGFDLTAIAQTAPVIVVNGRGTITLSHASTAVVTGTYGGANRVIGYTVDALGHLTAASNVAIDQLPAAAITSGTLAVARGGTGQTAITVNGSILIGNTVSGGFDVNALTQGSGITITNDKGAITVATTGTAAAAFPPMSMSGFTYLPSTTIAANGISFSTGACRDAGDAQNIRVDVALDKQANVAWAVGNSAGMLDTGAISNADYYLWAIKRTDTGVTDFLSSLSHTAPTMPTNYDAKRLIGWFIQRAGVLVLFNTYETEGGGLELNWRSPTLDVNLADTLTSGAGRTDAVKVPLNFSTDALVNALIQDVTTLVFIWIHSPDQADMAPSSTVAPLYNLRNPVLAQVSATQLRVKTSATGTIAARSVGATVDTYSVSTMGFTWARRN